MPIEVHINSRNRINGSDSAFSYNIPVRFLRQANRVAVAQISIPTSIYVIEEGRNTFSLEEDGTTVDISIPVGNYTRRTFKNELVSQLNSSSPNGWTYSITIPSQPDTGKYIYNVSGNAGVQPKFIFGERRNKIWERMGFSFDTTYTFTGDSLTSVNFISLVPEQTLFLRSDTLTTGNTSEDNLLLPIYVGDSPNGSNRVFINPDLLTFSKVLTSKSESVHNFALTDEDGFLVNLNGRDLDFILVFFYVEEN